MIKLTIGIPTFNGGDCLRETIENILRQVRGGAGVELLICDNHSEDGTQGLVEEFVQNYPDTITYVRHEKNLGVDRNFWSIIKNARGEFVHLHGDDDFYTPNGIKRVLDKINTYADLDVILLSNNFLNTRNGKILLNKESGVDDVLCKNDGEKFYLHGELKLLTLSNVVVRRARCLEIADIEKYFGCQWLHVAILTRLIHSTSSAYIFNYKEPIMTVRIGNQKWLENEGAVDFYYKLLMLLSELNNISYGNMVFEHMKTLLLPMVNNGGRINFTKVDMNILYCLKFFKFYYNMPRQYIMFCLRLLLKKHRPFFEGWEYIGN